MGGGGDASGHAGAALKWFVLADVAWKSASQKGEVPMRRRIKRARAPFVRIGRRCVAARPHRCGLRAHVMEKEEEGAPLTLLSLPLLLVLHIFSLLPVDCRLRCAEVCRGWRGMLSERSLWTRLELTAAESGVRMRQGRGSIDSLLRCAAARSGGGLQSLQVGKNRVSHAALLEVTAANAGALRELHAHYGSGGAEFQTAVVETLLGAAPLLRTFATGLFCYDADAQAACSALRNEAPFGALRVRRLTADLRGQDEAGVIALAADVAAHVPLEGLYVRYAPLGTPAAIDTVVDAALTGCLQSVKLEGCRGSPISAPALARLLGGNALTNLVCWNMRLTDAPAAAVLAAALRANATLTALSLAGAGVWRNPAAGAELLGALNRHPSLRVLDLTGNDVADGHQADVGACLGTLVASNAPALMELNVSWCDLGDDGLRALFDALPYNTHLRSLMCYGNDMSDAFARDVLLPAVRANTSLRTLSVGLPASACEAQALVAQRPSDD
jgi:hypothetical protein